MNTTQPRIVSVKTVKIFSPCKISIVYNKYSETDLSKLEAKLENSWEEDSVFTKDNMPKCFTFVAVKDEDGRCKRGYITTIHNAVIEIFICDYGTILNIEDLRKIIPLKEEYKTELKFYAAIVIIPGLFPATIWKLPSGEKLRACNTWSKQAHAVVEDWLKDSTAEVAVTPFKSTEINIYGDFYKKGFKKSLSMVLCDEKLASVDSNRFMELIS